MKTGLEELSLGKCGQRSVDSDAFLPLLHRLPQVANGEEHCLPSVSLARKAVSGSVLNETLKTCVSLLLLISFLS